MQRYKNYCAWSTTKSNMNSGQTRVNKAIHVLSCTFLASRETNENIFHHFSLYEKTSENYEKCST